MKCVPYFRTHAPETKIYDLNGPFPGILCSQHSIHLCLRVELSNALN